MGQRLPDVGNLEDGAESLKDLGPRRYGKLMGGV